MEAETIGILLLALGLIMVAVEAIVPGGYVIIFGAILIALGVYAVLWPDFLFTWKTVLVAAAVGIPVTAGTVWLYTKLGSPEPPTTTITDSLIGREGIVVTDIIPGTLKGKVKIGSDIWSADSDEELSKDTAVVVDHSEGVHVVVKRR
jgi:membrane protein implicated in regulation of membrane protease activity